MRAFLFARAAQIISLECKKHRCMEPTEELNELDRAFDLLLVLLGIITSTLFQFQSTRLPLEIAALNPDLAQEEIFAEVNN